MFGGSFEHFPSVNSEEPKHQVYDHTADDRPLTKTDVWMPTYWGDLLADTLHLSRSDFGSYMLLIGAYWRRGSALPDDDESLRSISRCHTDEWKRSRVVLQAFFRVENGLWTHKRIERELLLARENQQKNQLRTKAATAARMKKDEPEANVTKHVTNNVTFTPSPSPSPSSVPAQSQSPTDGSANESRQRRMIASICDADWIASLESNEAYEGINIKRELAKMNTWCANKQKRPSRQRFINWLNRCEVPMHVNGNSVQQPLRPHELKLKIDAKERIMQDLKLRHCSEAAMGDSWSSQQARTDFYRLKREVRELNNQLGSV